MAQHGEGVWAKEVEGEAGVTARGEVKGRPREGDVHGCGFRDHVRSDRI